MILQALKFEQMKTISGFFMDSIDQHLLPQELENK
jgi:hypothetical protein